MRYSSDDSRESRIRQAQDSLDREYLDLEAKEKVLTDAMQKLKEDEKSLEIGIASVNGSRQAALRDNQQKNLAIQRLEQALLESSSEDDDKHGDEDDIRKP